MLRTMRGAHLWDA